jgi:hypothetical protein
MATAAIGYPAAALDAPPPAAYANVARTAYQAIGEYAADVRAGRQIGRPLPPLPAPPPAPAAGEGEREACPKR